MIEDRKAEHINIACEKDTSTSRNYWDDVILFHEALPEVDLPDVNTSCLVFGKKLMAPVVIAAITGGFPKAKEINENLARAAAESGVGMGVGSQRASVVDRGLEYTYSIIKDYDVPLRIGNIGAPQLISQPGKSPLTEEDVRYTIESINADILAVHLNYLQEVIQPEGDTNAKGCLEAIKKLSHLPLMAKETGAGMTKHTISLLKAAGVRALDIGGTGGTTFSGVEYYRAEAKNETFKANLGKLFWNWGIPAPASLINASGMLPAMATGGIRNGLDAARAVTMGAEACGIAGAILKCALKGYKETFEFLETIKEELRTAMFLSGASDVSEMKTKKYVIKGELKDWLEE